MSNPVISGDGIFSHVFVGAADLQKSTAFYDAALGALGIKNLGPFGNGWVLSVAKAGFHHRSSGQW